MLRHPPGIQTGTDGCIQSNYLCQKFPGPVDRFSLEVISKREVTKHLKEGTVTCCLTYIFDITCTDTFLTGCTLVLGGFSAPVKYGFSGAIPALISRRLLSP